MALFNLKYGTLANLNIKKNELNQTLPAIPIPGEVTGAEIDLIPFI